MALDPAIIRALGFCRTFALDLGGVERAFTESVAGLNVSNVATLHAEAFETPDLKADVVAALVPPDPDKENDFTIIARALIVATEANVFNRMIDLIGREAVSKAPEFMHNPILDAVRKVYLDQGAEGILQSIQDPNLDFLDGSIFKKLDNWTQATGFVKQDQTIVGTAFLVGPDTVLTCHHVACDETGKLLQDLEFGFPIKEQPKTTTPITARAVRLEQKSPPYGKCQRTRWDIGPEANDSLDYALIRLDRRLDGRAPIPITSSALKANQNHTFVFGYMGGDRIGVSIAQGVKPTEGQRFLHSLNTVPGMSGSPCLGPRAEAIGLHEAGFDPESVTLEDHKGWPRGSNRAINASAILEDLRKKTQLADPFAALKTSTELAIYSSAIRKTWARRGLDIAAAVGADDASRRALAREWSDLVERLGDPPPNSPDLGEAFHPIFRRNAVTAWIGNALAADSVDRVLIVRPREAGRGRGLSFLADICSARLRQPETSLLRLSWLSGSWQQQLGIEASDADRLRPSAGIIALDDVNAAIEKHKAQRAGRDDQDPAFATLNLNGIGTTQALPVESWITLALKLARADYRVILINPPGSSQDSIISAFEPAGFAPEVIEDFNHIGWPQIHQWGLAEYKTDWQAILTKIKPKWDEKLRLHIRHKEFSTVMAVWFVLALKKLGSDAL